MHRLYLIALSAIGAMFLLAMLLEPSQRVPARAGHAAAASPGHARRGPQGLTDDALVLERDGSGQFHLDATVNGDDVRFLVDTGADLVALTEDEAQHLGITLNPGDFQPVLRTASGAGMGAPVTLASVEVAGTELHEVHAMVVQGLEVNLLGQSVLRQLGGVELKGDRMVIRAR